MKNVHSAFIATIVLAAAPAFAQVDMTPDERSELRERAQGLQAERERNPSWDGGTRRVNEPRGDVKLDRNPKEVSTRTTRDVSTRTTRDVETRRERVTKKMKRAVKTLPGALVRKRR